MPPAANPAFDAALLDRENHPVALVGLKAYPVENWTPLLPERLAASVENIAYLLAVDTNYIRLYKPTGEKIGEPIVQFDTRQVLQHYDPEYGNKRVFGPYLLTLVEAWLRDLAYHWKSEKPPGSDELARAGLLEKFEGGTTQRLGA